MIILFYLIIFCIGLSFGSFLNCLVYRLANKKTILGRSFCPQCQHQIIWYDNIPLISFIFLKGRCRYCHQKISWQYPIVELLMGILFVFSVWRISCAESEFLLWGSQEFFLSIFKIVRDWIIFFTLTFIFVYDLRYLAIEDVVLLPASAVILILNLLTEPLISFLKDLSFWQRFGQMGLAILIGVGFFALQYILTRGKGIGLGDLRIGFFMAVVLSHWLSLIIALAISYLIGAAISLFLIAFKKKGFKSEVPLGPFLALGTFFVFTFGREIIDWIIRWSGIE